MTPLTHSTPISEPEESCQWVERYIAPRTLGVMVGTGAREAFRGGVESAASDQRCRLGSKSGVRDHLGELKLGTASFRKSEIYLDCRDLFKHLSRRRVKIEVSDNA